MHRLVGDEPRARERGRVEGDRHVVRDALADVRHRGVELEVLAAAHHGRNGERHVEEGIAHEHAAAGLALDRHGPADQALEDGRDVEVEGVEALALAADQELGLALLAGGEAGDVVLGAGLAVGPDAQDGQGRRLGTRARSRASASGSSSVPSS